MSPFSGSRIVRSAVVAVLSSVVAFSGARAEDSKKGDVETLMAYSFSDSASIGNLVPSIFVGAKKFKRLGKSQEFVVFRAGPSVAGVAASRDTVSFAQGMMLPGSFGFEMGASIQYRDKEKQDDDMNALIASLYLGGALKVTSGPSSASVVQNALKASAGLYVPTWGALNLQYSVAQHDLTSRSAASFRGAFTTGSTNLQYLTFTAVGYVPIKEVYTVVRYSKAIGANAGRLPEGGRSVLSIGLGLNFDFGSAQASNATL